MMVQIAPATLRTYRTALFLTLAAFFISACGLGMNAQDRLDRGQQAYEDGEYRAAVIDAKNVLLDEPDNIAARLLLGHTSVELGDGISGEKEFRVAVGLGADFGELIVGLGRALLLQRKFDDVIAEVAPELAKTDVDRLIVTRLRGDALIGLGQPIAARDLYTEVLAADADDIEAQLGVVNSYIAERNYAQARETLNQILTFDDSYVPAWLASGALSMRMRNAQRAASDYDIAAKLAKGQSDDVLELQALSGFADAVMIQSKPDDARPALVRMLEIAPQDTRTLLVSARLAAEDEDWTTAQSYLQEILRRAPDYRPAQMLLGVVHKESGNLSQAEMYLSAVVAAVPSNANARRLLAETRLQLNKAVEARQALEPIIAAEDADINSLSMAAGASINLGEFDDAAELLQRALASDPENIDLQIQLAFAYFRSGESDRAQQILNEIPAELAGSSEFRRDSLFVLTQMAQGRRDEALVNARALLTRWPDRAEAHSLVGSIEMSNGDYAAARKSFDAASKLAPDDVRLLRYLAQLDIAENDPESAKDRYLVILSLQPKDALSMVALARIAALGEKQDETREWLEKAREADATSVTVRRILGTLYLAFREFSAAEDVAKEALNLEPENAKLHNILGLAQLNQDDYRGAVFSFGQSMKLDPAESSYRLNMARAQAKRGNDASAQVTLQDSMDRSLRHIPSAVMLASLKADAGDLDGAKNIARQLRELHPDDAAPYALEAELFARGGDLMAASASYDRALGIQNTQRYAIRAYQIRNQAGLANQVEPLSKFLQERPLDSNMRIYLAQAYQGLDEAGNANAEYERVLLDEPDNFIAANNLAWGYFKTGDPRAEELGRRAYEMRPNNSSILDTLGWILVKKGALQDGVEMLRSATELSNNRAEIRYHLAAGLIEVGNADEARDILQDLLSVDDGFTSRREAEELLSTL